MQKKWILTRRLYLSLALLLGVLTLAGCMLGVVPSILPSVDAQQNTAPEIASIDIPEIPSEAIPLFTQNCSACHGPAGEGTDIAPPLNSAELRSRLDDEAIFQTIRDGRPGTAMPVWGNSLSDAEITALVALIRNWDKLDEAQLQAIASQSEECGGGMGMHPGMHPGMGPMMGRGCGGGMPAPWWMPFQR